MNATPENDPSVQMKASDADRDAVLSDLSEHFQAGRLTADEFEDRTGRVSAIAARAAIRAPVWWTDGVGQAVPSHLRLRRT